MLGRIIARAQSLPLNRLTPRLNRPLPSLIRFYIHVWLIRHEVFFRSPFFRNFLDDFSLFDALRREGLLLRLLETNDTANPSTIKRGVYRGDGKKRKKEGKKESFRDLLRNGEKMNVEARQKDGKRSPVKRPGAPVSVDTALVEHNARPGRLSLTITVCYLVQLKHPLSLSSFFPQPLPLLRCFFVQRDAHGRARKVHWHCAGACINFACSLFLSFFPLSYLQSPLSLSLSLVSPLFLFSVRVFLFTFTL